MRAIAHFELLEGSILSSCWCTARSAPKFWTLQYFNLNAIILCIKIAFIAEVPTAECWGCVILEIQYARNMKVLTKRNPIWPCLVQKWASLQKTGFYALNSEWKKVPAGSHSSLAHGFLLLAAFWCLLVHFLGEKSILPYFSSLSMVAISVSFPEVRNRKGTESGLAVGTKSGPSGPSKSLWGPQKGLLGPKCPPGVP